MSPYKRVNISVRGTPDAHHQIEQHIEIECRQNYLCPKYIISHAIIHPAVPVLLSLILWKSLNEMNWNQPEKCIFPFSSLSGTRQGLISSLQEFPFFLKKISLKILLFCIISVLLEILWCPNRKASEIYKNMKFSRSLYIEMEWNGKIQLKCCENVTSNKQFE